MDNARVIFGSTTGVTEGIAAKIAAALGCEAANVANATARTFDAALLVLGTSTWGMGDLQDDWAATGMPILESLDLKGRKVAAFGLGDGLGFADTFCDGVATLIEAAVARGAENVGAIAAADGSYGNIVSKVAADGRLTGLALDETNEPELTDRRIAAWVSQLKAAM